MRFATSHLARGSRQLKEGETTVMVMKRYGTLALALALVAGCESDSPTEPSNPNPNQLVFTGQLRASNEVPPVTGAEANAQGDVRITMDVTRDGSGTITGGTATFVINLSGFPAGTNAIAAHIHEGAPGVAGPVRIGVLPITPNAPIAMAGGTASNVTHSGVEMNAAGVTAANAMLNNPNGFYFNVHTPSNPGGAVRGQLVRQQ
jgi:hypothetical protein